MNYQIKTFSDALWIIPSGAPSPANESDVELRVPNVNGPGLLPGKAEQDITGTIKLKWLPAVQPTEAVITVPKEVLFGDRALLYTAWQEFICALDEQNNPAYNYMIPQGPALIKQLLQQNIPMRQQDVKYYQLRFAYDDKQFIDLLPGMRLKLAFSNFYDENPKGAGKLTKGFAGTGVSYAYIQSVHNGNYLSFNSFMDLQQVKVKEPKEADMPVANIKVLASVADLAALSHRSYYRLYYPQEGITPVNKADLSPAHSVCLAGASAYKDLPAQPKVEDTAYSLSVFNGRCTVTPQLLIKVNGKPVYVSAGATLKTLLEQESLTGILPARLTMLRYQNYQRGKVFFTEPAVLPKELYLLPGDDVSWVASGNFALNERVKAIYRITKPEPEALPLGELTVQSFGTDEGVVLPLANDLSVALLESHQAPYNSGQISKALYPIYNKAPFTPPYTGDELAYSLYFTGFDVLGVSTGVVAGYTPEITMPEGGTLALFLLRSGIGYTAVDISKGIHAALNNSDRASASYIVKALIVASHNSKQEFSAITVAKGLYYALGYTLDNAFEFATALVVGSAEAGLPGRYTAGEVARNLYIIYKDNAVVLSQVQLANILALAWKGPVVAYTVTEVASGVAAVYLDITPAQMATALRNCGAGYTMNDVAQGTYAIAYGAEGDKRRIDVEALATILKDVYADQRERLQIDVAIAVKYVTPDIDINTLGGIIARVFAYTSAHEDHYLYLSHALAAAYNFNAGNQDDVNKLANAIKTVLQLDRASRDHSKFLSKALRGINGIGVTMAVNGNALCQAFNYVGTAQADVTLLIGDWFFAWSFNNGVQDHVSKLAIETKAIFNYSPTDEAQLTLLATGIRDALGYSESSYDNAAMTSYAIEAAMPGIDVFTLVMVICRVFKGILTPSDQEQVNRFAMAIRYRYNLDPGKKEDALILTQKLAAIYSFIKLNRKQKNQKIALLQESSEAITATGLIYAFDYKGIYYQHVNITAYAIVKTFTSLGQFPLCAALVAAFKYGRDFQNQDAVSFVFGAMMVTYGNSLPVIINLNAVMTAFDANPAGRQYTQQEVNTIANATAFAYKPFGVSTVSDFIAGFIQIMTSSGRTIDDRLLWNAAIPGYNLIISKEFAYVNLYRDAWNLSMLWQGVFNGRRDQKGDDAAIIDLAKFSLSYFGPIDYSLGERTLIGWCIASITNSLSLTYSNINHTIGLLAKSYEMASPEEPWRYKAIDTVAGAMKTIYPKLEANELLVALKATFPGLLPVHAGKAVKWSCSINSMDAIGNLIGESYNLRIITRYEPLIFAMLLDQFGWEDNARAEKREWLTKWYGVWYPMYEDFVVRTSTEKIFQEATKLIIANKSPVEMAVELQNIMKPPSKHDMKFLGEMIEAVFCNYYLLAKPEAGVETLARCTKATKYDELLAGLSITNMYRKVLTETVVKRIVKKVYAEPV